LGRNRRQLQEHKHGCDRRGDTDQLEKSSPHFIPPVARSRSVPSVFACQKRIICLQRTKRRPCFMVVSTSSSTWNKRGGQERARAPLTRDSGQDGRSCRADRRLLNATPRPTWM